MLIVTGSYAPVMIADMHRARQLAWELPNHGWDVEILSPGRSYQPPSCVDSDSDIFFPRDIPVHFAPEYGTGLFRSLNIRSIGLRAMVPVLRMGRNLLATGRFQLIYFSTAQFPLFAAGPRWRNEFGIPFLLDFHDPLYKEGRTAPAGQNPSVKHAAANVFARWLEAYTTMAASGLISVSRTYLEMLERRYGERKPVWLARGRHAVVPFAGLPRDLEVVAADMAASSIGPKPFFRIVYVGAGGPVMRRSFSLLCSSLAELRKRNPRLLDGVRFELLGTMLGWPAGDPREMADHAGHLGLGDLIREEPERVSYRRSIELLLESDGALILGVDDAGYIPSKLFGYALAGKPLLGVVRRDGPAYGHMQELGAHVLWFDASADMPLTEATAQLGSFIESVASRRSVNRRAALEPMLSSTMARRHAELFEACLQPHA